MRPSRPHFCLSAALRLGAGLALVAGLTGCLKRETNVQRRDREQVLLQRVCGELSRRGFAIGNIDATVIAEKPKIFPHLAAMKAVLAKSTHLPGTNIGLKATTNEGVGDLGRGLAIAAHAVALIAKV